MYREIHMTLLLLDFQLHTLKRWTVINCMDADYEIHGSHNLDIEYVIIARILSSMY